MTRDAAAFDQLKPPHHYRFFVQVTLQHKVSFQALKQLADVARRAATYVQPYEKIRKPC